jgi:putative DNA primase/helicase
MAGKTSSGTPRKRVDVRKTVISYIKRGWKVIPVPYKSKAPNTKGWPDLRLGSDDINAHFASTNQNVGVLLGEPSGWLVDVDLDCAEAVELAADLLPETDATFGRKSRPKSHRLYVAKNAPSAKFEDTDGSMLLEIRSTGLQTIFPPSTHPSGERVRWVSKGKPAKVGALQLWDDCAILASVCLLARHWPVEGSRQKAALALSGALLRAGFTVGVAE